MEMEATKKEADKTGSSTDGDIQEEVDLLQQVFYFIFFLKWSTATI